MTSAEKFNVLAAKYSITEFDRDRSLLCLVELLEAMDAYITQLEERIQALEAQK